MAETWLFWNDGAHEPPWNMAADEALLLDAPGREKPLLRCYAWSRPAVSIGYVQTLAAAPAGYAAVRRPTGGGVVYHDYDFTFSVTFPMGHWLTGLDRMQSYNWLNRSLQRALESLGFPARLSAQEIPHQVDRARMVCFTNPTRYDLLLEGRKIAGSAQRRTAAGLLHQASLHWGAPLPVERPLLVDALRRGLREVMEVETLPWEPGEPLLQRIQDLVTTKYGTDDWNRLR
ncbi:MAG: biotin/lipoate A/B protein ligase family protein [Oligosphaeraceae bacterium]